MYYFQHKEQIHTYNIASEQNYFILSYDIR